jgi:gamma-butyrobetaine dioxygenase
VFEEFSYAPDRVSIVWDDGRASDFHSLWLRDNDPENRDPYSGQRRIDVADLPAEAEIARAVPAADTLRVFWTDGVVASYTWAWLRTVSAGPAAAPPARLWKASDSGVLTRFSYPQIRESADCCLEWFRAIASLAIAFLQDVPRNGGEVLEVASLIGWIRETNYGRVFDVRAEPHPNNLAYTELALGLHTDNPYRDPVPGLQILHVLKAGEGGESQFADGFAVAAALRASDACAFEILSSTPVRFEFSDSGTRLSAARPIIELDRNGATAAVHYNNRSIAPLRLPVNNIASFYRAYRSFAILLRDPAFVVTTALREGEAVVFDNRRVLHGRTAFNADTPRHLQGCYLERDGLFSKLALLEGA